MKFVRALNAVHSNVWGVLLILVGIALIALDQTDHVAELIVGGFALVRSASSTSSEAPSTDAK